MMYLLVLFAYLATINTQFEANNDRLPKAEFFDQRLDHFDNTNPNFWKQRYWVYSKFFDKLRGPVFLVIGGQNRVKPEDYFDDISFDMAKELNALFVLIEQRFQGESRPTKDLSVANLKYYNIQQVVADLALFRDFIKEKYNLTKANKWVSFGCSYAGLISALFRLKYPHLVDAAISSSAALNEPIAYDQYLEVVQQSLEHFSPGCSNRIKMALDEIDENLNKSNTKTSVENIFKLCEPIKTEMDKTQFHYDIINHIRQIVQRNLVNSKTKYPTITEACKIMQNDRIGSPMFRYAEINSIILSINNLTCLDSKYSNIIRDMTNLSQWDMSPKSLDIRRYRQWYWLLCNGDSFHTTYSKNQPFGNRLPLEFYIKTCQNVFGLEFNLEYVLNASKYRELEHGGLNYKGSNVLFTQGKIDPWYAGGFTSQEQSPQNRIIIMQNTSHCAETYEPRENDSQELKDTRKEIILFLKNMTSV